MQFPRKTVIFLLIVPFLLILSNSLNGQKVVHIVGKGSVYEQKIHGSYLYMMLGFKNSYRSDLYRMKIPFGNPEPLDTNIRWGQSVLMTDSGVFYVSVEYDANGNDGKHYLNYFSFSKNSKVFSKVINLYVEHPYRTRPISPIFSNGKFYICAYFDGKNCIWESDGTDVGTKTILSSDLDLSNYSIFLGKPIVISYFGNDQILLDHNNQQIYKYKATALNKLTFFHNSNDVCILSKNGTQLIRITEQYQIDSLSFAIKGFRPFYVSYANDSMITGYNQVSGKPYTFNLKIVPPFTYDSVPPSQFLQSIGKTELDKTKSQFMSIWSMKHGVEMAFAPRFDSIRLIQDLYPGPNSGMFNVKVSGDMIEAENTAYFFGRNGSDKKYYLYSCDGKSMKSHFPVDVSRNLTKLVCKNDSFIYWSYFIQDSLFIEYRNLYQIDSQPPFKYYKNDNHAKNGEWLRTAACVSSLSQLIPYYKIFHSNAVKCDKNGNVFSSGSIPQQPGNGYGYMCYSDTNLFQNIKGDKFIVKYDSFGNLLWNFSFGNYRFDNQTYFGFAIDNQGDVVVASRYYTELFLDTLVLRDNQAVSYVFKLDGQTGRIKWLNQFMAHRSFDTDPDQKIAIDNENNIYVGFNFYGGFANIGSFQINSMMSPANAILKLDKDGKNLWAKCTETPWTDMYGVSRSLTFDSLNQCIYNLIGQGAYNFFSPCKYSNFKSIVHKINKNGEFNEVQKIEGDDLNGSRVMTMTKNNSIFMSGFYRGDLSIAQLSTRSALDENIGCNKWDQFYATLSKKNGEVLSLSGSSNYEFFPLDVCSDDRYIYVLGASGIPNEKIYSLSIQRYTHLGRLAGKRLLDQCLVESPFDLNEDYNIALNGNSHFVISMNAYSRISPFDNFVDNYDGLSVYRLLKEADWIDEPIKTEKQVLSGIILAPNPASDFIGLQFNNPVDYSKLIIYNSLGQLVQTNSLSGEIYQSISIENLSLGIYTVQFQGQKVQSMKLIVN